MNIKEAIEYLEGIKKEAPMVLFPGNYVHQTGIDEIISLLERGDKFEKMWGELKERNISFSWRLGEDFEELQQKYFPSIKSSLGYAGDQNAPIPIYTEDNPLYRDSVGGEEEICSPS